MKYKKELLLKPGIAIQCNNFKEFETIINLMKKEGVKCLPPNPKLSWDHHNGTANCVAPPNPNPFNVFYCGIYGGYCDGEYYKNKNYEILLFKDVVSEEGEE
jgi:hypothetical protein